MLNFANPDMVGHTGSLPAAIKAVETVDASLGRIVDAIAASGGALLVTADHGNCELMRDPVTGAPHTAHTTNPVPVVFFGKPDARLHDGRLADIAPTLLRLLEVPQPDEMTGAGPRRAAPVRFFDVALSVVVLAGLGASSALAVTPPARDELAAAERNRAAQLQIQHDADARAQTATAQARRLVDEKIAAAAKLRDAENATADAAARVASLAERERDAQARLDERARAFIPMLPVIERLSSYPAETLLAMPVPPEQALRGVLALQGLAHELESQAAALRAEQAGILSLRAELGVELPRYAAARDAQARQAEALDQQIASAQATRSAAEEAAEDAARRAAAEAARADGLRAAIAKLDAEQRDAQARARQEADTATRQKRDADAAEARQREAALARPAGPDIGAARGQVVAPVAGGVTRAFGAVDDSGASNGISYQAPPAARVVSPCGGRVVFAGPFRSYGQLMIIDCGAGYHFVLAGMDRLDARVGHPVRAGEPVGVMPGWDPRALGSHPSLYVELRQHGQPIDPAPFLRAKG